MLPLLLCQVVAPAPQALTDSDITYVKLQPLLQAPTAASHHRESRIENLALTIPGNITLDKETNLHNKTESDQSSDLTLPESTNLSEMTALPKALPKNIIDKAGIARIESDIDLSEDPAITERVPDRSELPQRTEPDSAPELNLPEITAIPDNVPDGSEPEGTEELLEAYGSDILDTYQSERRGRIYDSLETTDIFEDVTEKYATNTPEIIVPRTKPTPKFVPKLSYFQKPHVFVSFPTNSLEKTARRRFRSHCRCEKIWNCPKLQITVPRCPDEYFLCCF